VLARRTDRTLTVLKLKDEESGAEWPIRLTPVDGQRFPVVEIGEVESATPFEPPDTGEWSRADVVPQIPLDVAEKIDKEAAKVEGREAEVARWIWRYLQTVDEEQGSP
jgi:hypothetical protein